MAQDDISTLLLEIYERTGCKISADDPVVGAALVQSHLIRAAGVDAANSIKAAVEDAVADLGDAVRIERLAAADAQEAYARALRQFREAATSVANAEMSRSRPSAQEGDARLQDEAPAQPAPPPRKFHLALTLVCVSVASAAAGAMIAVAVIKNGQPAITQEEVRSRVVGQQVMEIWPALDIETRSKILDAIAHNPQPVGSNQPHTPANDAVSAQKDASTVGQVNRP